MSKYIIEVGDAYAEHICGKGDMLCLPVRINEFDDNWMNTNIPLTPYTEPDTEKVREEAYEDGYKTAKVQCNIQAEKDLREVGERHYQKGLSDAWAAARKLWDYDLDTLKEIFGWVAGKRDVFIIYTAAEAIEKIRQYEQKQETIQVGDEVYVEKLQGKAVVMQAGKIMCCTFQNGDTFTPHMEDCKKTGRHFPEIAEILQKMKKES